MGDRIAPLDPRTGNNRKAPLRRNSNFTLKPTPYKLRTTPRVKRTGWIASICWWVLHKIGGLDPHFEKIEVYEYTTPIQQRITDRIMFAAEEILARRESPNDYAIVMGEYELASIWKEMELNGYITMRSGAVHYRTRGYRAEAHGFNVHAVGGLHGVALIPKVLIEKVVQVPEPTHRSKDAGTWANALHRIKNTITVSECQKIAREALGE
ncbi:MAG: hypothetical protein JXQ79_10200 [Rhodobacteraceae bacterium]|nr:hypothetical protein [Paracoccaceae bacterium]